MTIPILSKMIYCRYMPKGIYKRTEKHSKIISASKKGSIPWNKGKKGLQKAWNKGKKCPWTTERNIIMNTGRTGEKAFHWKGGKTSRERKILMARKKYQEWRLLVLERDSFMCQSCYVKGEILHAHHIKSWLEYEYLRYDVGNGVSLCRKCHEDIHRKSK